MLAMDDFDMIFDINWLSSYHAIVGCFNKIVKFKLEDELEFMFQVME